MSFLPVVASPDSSHEIVHDRIPTGRYDYRRGTIKPMNARAALLVPEASVTRVGQLEYVSAVIDKRLRQVLVRTIPADKGMCEVVSGIEAGMQLVRQ